VCDRGLDVGPRETYIEAQRSAERVSLRRRD
jgi:hypothetical protein